MDKCATPRIQGILCENVIFQTKLTYNLFIDSLNFIRKIRLPYSMAKIDKQIKSAKLFSVHFDFIWRIILPEFIRKNSP